jgi:threonine dehydratase
MAVTADQIRDTAVRLDGQIIRTPMLEAPMLSRNLGCELFLKLECLQHTSSFKARGALNAMLGLNDKQRQLGVIAMSAGNHAQAVGLSRRTYGHSGNHCHASPNSLCQSGTHPRLWCQGCS